MVVVVVVVVVVLAAGNREKKLAVLKPPTVAVGFPDAIRRQFQLLFDVDGSLDGS